MPASAGGAQKNAAGSSKWDKADGASSSDSSPAASTTSFVGTPKGQVDHNFRMPESHEEASHEPQRLRKDRDGAAVLAQPASILDWSPEHVAHFLRTICLPTAADAAKADGVDGHTLRSICADGVHEIESCFHLRRAQAHKVKAHLETMLAAAASVPPRRLLPPSSMASATAIAELRPPKRPRNLDSRA